MAGRDIRRLVAFAHMASGPEKVLTARRLIAGVRSVGDLPVYIPDDKEGLARRIAQDVDGIQVLDGKERSFGTEETMRWVTMMVDAGVAVLIVVGGDGTQRLVAKVNPPIPIMPVAGGTNNVSCWTGDQTAAGIAAGWVAAFGLSAGVGARLKILRVRVDDGPDDLALIDLAHIRSPFVGALAVWEADAVSSLFLNVADPVRPGLSNVGGFIAPIGAADDRALYIELGEGGTSARGILAPGLMATFHVRNHRLLKLGEVYSLRLPEASTIALDGERTVTLRPGQVATVWTERSGPLVVNPARVLAADRHNG